MRASLLAKNLALASLSIVVTLLALELVARALRKGDGEPVAARYTQHDPLLGWVHRPGARAVFANGDYLINSHGLRDKERAYHPAPGTTRLMVLGDSFAEGFSVRFEDAVSQVLERELARPGCPLEAIAAGTVGYSTDQEYLYYREEGFKYEPTVVLLFLYYNDILYNAREGVGRTPKPLLTFAGGVSRVRNLPVPPPPPEAAPAATGGASGSAALAFIRGRMRDAWPNAYDSLARLGLWPPRVQESPGLELAVYNREPSQPMQQAWEQTVHILRALQAEATSHRAQLLAVYVPSKMEVSERDWALTRSRYGVSDATWDRGALARRLAQAGGDAGFAVLDLTEPLRRADHGVLGGPYHAGGGHWNALGHRVAGAEVARVLRERGWVPACSVK